jgi:hypothetical protein
MLVKPETVQSAIQRLDDTQYTYQHLSPLGQRILIATVSGVTAGLQALVSFLLRFSEYFRAKLTSRFQGAVASNLER